LARPGCPGHPHPLLAFESADARDISAKTRFAAFSEPSRMLSKALLPLADFRVRL
jgi:hypothetical protein